MECTALQRAIGELESELDPAANQRVIDELATVRRGLSVASRGVRLPNLRIGFACKQRWEDMIGDDRVRACAGCDRPVFNLSEMTHQEAERVLATRGLTPCVRFYRRPDGTVMTKDCPSGEARQHRRLAVVAGSLAAGAALATPSSAGAQPATEPPEIEAPPETVFIHGTEPTIDVTTVTMGVTMVDAQMSSIVLVSRPRPRIEWSVWGRIGMGVAAQHATVLARTITPPEPDPSATSIWEAALATDLTVGIGRDGDLRIGAFGELRTTTDAVLGGELIVEGLPPHPMSSRMRGAGSIVLRGGASAHFITGALGFGYVGLHPSRAIPWAGHTVGVRVVGSVNHSRDDPRDWSATIGVEIEPIGALHAVLDLANGR